jgi:hypothetical protein
LTAVVWLLCAVPAAATAAVSSQLIQTPLVPLGLAKALAAVGVRIRYAQLLAAAHCAEHGARSGGVGAGTAAAGSAERHSCDFDVDQLQNQLGKLKLSNFLQLFIYSTPYERVFLGGVLGELWKQ